MRMRIFSCYRWKTEGRKKKGYWLVKDLSYTSFSALCLRFHMPVSASMRVVSKITAEGYCTGAHCALSFGQGQAPGKSHLCIVLCFSGDNAY